MILLTASDNLSSSSSWAVSAVFIVLIIACVVWHWINRRYPAETIMTTRVYPPTEEEDAQGDQPE